jgi:uncharacterized protein YcbX
VKSLAAEALVEVLVESSGFPGDRGTALIVSNAGHARTGKPFRGKEHRLLHTVTSPKAAQALGAAAGIELEAVTGEHFFDAQPISLLFDTWLHDVELLVGRPLEPLRYRPNIFALAAPGFDAREHALVDTTLRAGTVRLHVVATIGRCVTTTYDLATGEGDPAVLREVAQRRANTVGVYCAVEHPGAIAHADPIMLL